MASLTQVFRNATFSLIEALIGPADVDPASTLVGARTALEYDPRTGRFTTSATLDLITPGQRDSRDAEFAREGVVSDAVTDIALTQANAQLTDAQAELQASNHRFDERAKDQRLEAEMNDDDRTSIHAIAARERMFKEDEARKQLDVREAESDAKIAEMSRANNARLVAIREHNDEKLSQQRAQWKRELEEDDLAYEAELSKRRKTGEHPGDNSSSSGR